MRRTLVFITIDTEFWPSSPDFRTGVTRAQLDPERELRRDIFGVTSRGAFGIERQLDLFRAHGLRATYFTEALCASVAGPAALERVVTPILQAGQDVQLHIHTEWLKVQPNTILPGRAEQHIRNFTLEEQQFLLGLARDNLVAAGAPAVTAFRAGNFGASWETVQALAAIGLTYDSSHNACFVGGACDMPTEGPLRHPARFHGMWELPVSCFEDLPGRLRPAQISAASTSEFRHTLLEAWRRQWPAFVIVTHSNELLNARKDGPNPITVSRLERLCEFLAAHRDKFETVGFDQLDPAQLSPAPTRDEPIRSNALRTALRVGEQVAQRWIA